MSASRMLDDERGAIAWLLSQLGLLLAAGVLIGAIAGLTFYSDWEKRAEAKNIASGFATAIESVALKEFPEKTTYRFPRKEYRYTVTLSTSYVTVSRPGGLVNDNIVAREALLIRPWPHPPMANGTGASGVYTSLGGGSRRETSIPRHALDSVFNHTRTTLATHPYAIDVDRPVYIEKMFIYTGEGVHTTREEYVIVYQ